MSSGGFLALAALGLLVTEAPPGQVRACVLRDQSTLRRAELVVTVRAIHAVSMPARTDKTCDAVRVVGNSVSTGQMALIIGSTCVFGLTLVNQDV